MGVLRSEAADALFLLGAGFASIILAGAENDYYDHDSDGFRLDDGGFVIMALALLFVSVALLERPDPQKERMKEMQ